MQRRKFIAGMGSLAAAGAAGIGTGAFTSASATRTVTAHVDNDLNAQIALVPGQHSGIELNGNGELEIDLSGDNGEGVNPNSQYSWGDPNDPANDFAFKIVNNDGQDYDDLILEYELEDDSWVDNSTTYDNESFIRFDTYGQGDPDGYWAGIKCPNNQLGTPNPVSKNMPTSGPVDFESGQAVYVVVETDTTGVDADLADDLSGSLTINVEGPGGN